jgi:DNA-binding transcriptional ArsR family regulator
MAPPRNDTQRKAHSAQLVNPKAITYLSPMPTAAESRDRIFQALGDPSRRAIFETLARGEAVVKDLTERFDISQPAVSQHLATLKRAGLVSGRREGRNVYYRVEPKGMKPLIDWMAHYQVFWTDRLGRLAQLLEKMDR